MRSHFSKALILLILISLSWLGGIHKALAERTADAAFPEYSPDGSRIAFRSVT